MLTYANSKAYAVLSILVNMWGEDTHGLRTEGYDNGREHGFHVAHFSTGVSFSEHRSSDNIVVYYGPCHHFSMQGNVPDENMYKNNSRYFNHNEYLHAAEFIYKYLQGEKL